MAYRALRTIMPIAGWRAPGYGGNFCFSTTAGTGRGSRSRPNRPRRSSRYSRATEKVVHPEETFRTADRNADKTLPGGESAMWFRIATRTSKTPSGRTARSERAVNPVGYASTTPAMLASFRESCCERRNRPAGNHNLPGFTRVHWVPVTAGISPS
jgi:hypothetical protein